MVDHRTEEPQHVVTDSRYLDAIDLSQADKRTATAIFVCNFLEEFMVYRRLVADLGEALIGDRDPLTPPWRKNKCNQFITSAA